jgi:hypothetical protein
MNEESEVSDKEEDVMPWHLMDPSKPKVSKQEAAERYAICKQCPDFSSFTKQCTHCGCFMVLKTRLLKATCPLESW